MTCPKGPLCLSRASRCHIPGLLISNDGGYMTHNRDSYRNTMLLHFLLPLYVLSTVSTLTGGGLIPKPQCAREYARMVLEWPICFSVLDLPSATCGLGGHKPPTTWPVRPVPAAEDQALRSTPHRGTRVGRSRATSNVG